MNNVFERVSRITSSKIYLLTINGRGLNGFGSGAITYLRKKIAELDLCRGTELPVYKFDMNWGKLWEPYVNDYVLGYEYEAIINKTSLHKKYPNYWSGSPDFIIKELNKNIGVSELKCYQMDNFHAYTKCLLKQDLPKFKANFPQEYWQIVSNCIIKEVNIGEAMAFMPTEGQLIHMIDLCINGDFLESKFGEDEMFRFKFIQDRQMLELPFIPNGSDFPNFTRFRFEIPQEDIDFLTERVEKAIELLQDEDKLF